MGICSRCNESKNQSDLWSCDSCKRPVCSKCSDFTASEIKCMQLKKRVLMFICEDCRNGLCQVPMLRSEIKELRKLMDDIINNQTKTNSEVKVNPEGLAGEDMFDEINERLRRRNNLIIFGVEDKNCKDSDKVAVDRVLKLINANLDIGNYSFHRLGQFKINSQRPVKILLDSEQQVKEILKRSPILRNNVNLQNKVVVSQDRTPRQIQYYKEIKKQLLERRAEGESNIRIKYVRNVPKIVSVEESASSSSNLN